MRWPTLLLAALLVLIQYPLWLGKGGWFRVWELDRELDAQLAENHRQRERNAALAGEVQDLRQGSLAIEERARYELGMIGPEEFFVSVRGAASEFGADDVSPQLASRVGSSRRGARAEAPRASPAAASR